MFKEHYPVWKALADPTRRELLDLLREGPKTTGQLCEHFRLTRFGVMKHLSLLREGGLVVVRKSGRERWNHLNAVPIRQIYERWVSKYAGEWASKLTNLQRYVELQQQEGEGETRMSEERKNSFTIVQEHRINADRASVWKALTEGIDQWWPHRSSELKARMLLDARAGGRLIEQRDEDGAEKLWGIVIFMKENESIFFNGPVGMIRYALTNVYGFDLEEKDGATVIKLTHKCHGDIEPGWEEEFDAGWQEQWRYIDAYLLEGKTWRELQSA